MYCQNLTLNVAKMLNGAVSLANNEEFGAFMRLVALTWFNHELQPNNDITARLCHCEPERFAEIVKSLARIGVIDLTEDGCISIKFVVQAMMDDAQIRQRKAQYGRKGGQAGKGIPKQRAAENSTSFSPNSNEENGYSGKSVIKSNGNDNNNDNCDCDNTKQSSSDPSSPSEKYPESVEEVLDIAKNQSCVIMSRRQAETYLTWRLSTDWRDGSNRLIRSNRVPADIKRWVMREQQEQADKTGRKTTRATSQADMGMVKNDDDI